MWRPMLNCTSKKIIKIGHVVDIPCFIDADSVKKSIGFTFKKALEERNLGVLQILASLENNHDPIHGYRWKIPNTVIKGHLNVIKILAPITKDVNSICPEYTWQFFGDLPKTNSQKPKDQQAFLILKLADFRLISRQILVYFGTFSLPKC